MCSNHRPLHALCLDTRLGFTLIDTSLQLKTNEDIFRHEKCKVGVKVCNYVVSSYMYVSQMDMYNAHASICRYYNFQDVGNNHAMLDMY